MADVTSAISSLPGSGHAVPKGMTCDCHPTRPAVARIQGETDSFGCEMIDMCQECLTSHKEEVKNRDTSGVCDWCKTHKPKLFSRRDIDEGMYGPVYDVCRDCIDKDNKAIEEELKEYESRHGYFEYDY